MFRKAHVLLVCASLMTGCTSVNHTFDCGKAASNMCLPIHEVDARVSQHLIGSTKTMAPEQIPHWEKGAMRHTPAGDVRVDPHATYVPPTPLRTVETVLTVTVAPFVDEAGIWHETERLHVVSEPAHWRANGVHS